MISSKNTSINTTKLPAVYNKIDFDLLKNSTLVDYGCGRPETQKLIREHLSYYNINFVPYDPYWCTEEQNKYALTVLNKGDYNIFVSTNVLNVLEDEPLIGALGYINMLGKMAYENANWDKHFFVSVYEGNGSGIGKISKKDCYQRNEKTSKYCERLNNFLYMPTWWQIYKGVITNALIYLL